MTLLRQADATLLGSNVPVAQVEAPVNVSPPYDFEVNPATVGQPTNRFNYASALGTASGQFPNSVGGESSHAGSVALNYYSVSSGVAPQVSRVDNYEANYFIGSVVGSFTPPAISAVVVNSSYSVDGGSESSVNQNFDDYAAQRGTLFVSAIGNGQPTTAPGTCYNGIGVACVSGVSAVGPTSDGRCKPDLLAPDSPTSYATPFVSGAAAVLWQAAARGDGGSISATNSRVLKALLLNGALKPVGWTNSTSRPLDLRYGAGELHLFESWRQLAGGLQPAIETTTVSTGAAHPPGSGTGNLASLSGWNLGSLSTLAVPTAQDKVDHYYFNLPAVGGGAYTATTTLTWHRRNGQSGINDLDLFLYNATSGALVTCSTSAVDNVEHLYVPQLAAGRYDLQVVKHGSLGQISQSETYALAFEFFAQSLAVTRSNSSVVITWPLYPAGFTLQMASGVALPVTWSDVGVTPVVVSNQNRVVLTVGTNKYFRLRRN